MAGKSFSCATFAPPPPDGARIIEFGHEAEDFFYVTEWIEGETLAGFVERRGPLPTAQARGSPFNHQRVASRRKPGAGPCFWEDGVAFHGETLEMRANAAFNGQTARGRLDDFLGALILADIDLVIRVDSRAGAASSKTGAADPVTVRPFRRIFSSYSHRDLAIVKMMERHVRTLGDEYLRDWVHLRRGE